MIQSPPRNVVQVLNAPLSAFVSRVVTGMAGERWTVSSWWRSVTHNANVGGANGPTVWSQHLVGLAADLVGDPERYDTWVRRLRAQGLIAVNEHSHVHVQLLQRGVLRADHLRALRLL